MEKQKRTTGFKEAKRGEYIFYWSLLILPLLQFLIFYVAVNANSFLLAFKRYDSEGFNFEWAGFDNFSLMFERLSMKGSMLQNAVGTSVKAYFLGLINLPLSLFFSYYVYKKMIGSEVFKVVLFLPSILSGMVLGLLYQAFVDSVIPQFMWKHYQIKVFGDGWLSTDGTRFIAAFTFSFLMGFGGHILMYTGAMSRIPESIVEYARLEGVGAFREFFTITFPLIFPTVGTFFILGVSGFFTNQLGLYTFFGSDSQSVQTVGYYVYRLVVGKSNSATYPEAASIGLFFTFIIAPVTLLVRYLINRFDPSETY